MGSYPTRYRLPTNYSTAIGRLITRFANLESAIRQLIYALLELDNKLGRAAVKSPRVRDAFTMIEDILAIRSFSTTINIKLLAKECAKIEQFRDKVAHGVWVKHSGSNLPILQVTAGSYAETSGGQSVKARIKPQGIRVTLTDFRNYTLGIDHALKAIKTLALELGVQHAALRQRRFEQQVRDQSPSNLRPSRNRPKQ